MATMRMHFLAGDRDQCEGYCRQKKDSNIITIWQALCGYQLIEAGASVVAGVRVILCACYTPIGSPLLKNEW